jgi:pimeloyl-ACP methyl ester carboxylesterase
LDFDYVVIPALILLIGILLVWLSVRRMLSLSGKSYRTWRKVAERIVFAVVILVSVAVAGSASFNAIALCWFRAFNPPPGENYLVDGHKMHLVCTGSGSPTLVLEAGLGNDALIWGGVLPTLAKTTRVCAYDRAGFGWSDVRPAPRDADHIAAELHGLLAEAKVTGPIVLMGHSIAGIYLRDYATRYPEGLAGLVFVDGSTPMQQENPAFKAANHGGPPQWLEVLIERSMMDVGVPRLLGQCSRALPGFDPHAAKLQAEDLCHAQIGASMAEMASISASGAETVHTGPYGALPILILSQDPAKPMSGPAQDKLAGIQAAWNQMQEDLKKLSTSSRRIIAKGSTHYIQIDRADLIEKEVPLFIQQIRGKAPEPANYGSTVTE